MALGKSNFYKKPEHNHKSMNIFSCVEHEGRLTVFNNCPYKCEEHTCNGKTWTIEKNKNGK